MRMLCGVSAHNKVEKHAGGVAMDNQHRSFPHPLMRLPRAGDREIRQKDIRALPISRERKC